MQPDILTLHQWGYHLVPWKRDPRKPMVQGWQDKPTDPAGYLRAFGTDMDWAIVPTFACVLDLEMKGGLDGVADLARIGFDIAGFTCPITRTKSGGYHLWFRQPEEALTGGHHLMPGVEAKAKNGSVHIPPSKGYACQSPLVDAHSLPSMPQKLVDLWKSTARSRANTGTQTYRSEIYESGERRYKLCSMAGRLRSAGLNETELIAALLAVRDCRCADPSTFTDAEVIGIAKDYAKRPTTEALRPGSDASWIQVVGTHRGHGPQPSA